MKALLFELKASPKKAVMLGLFLLLSVLFWSRALLSGDKPTASPVAVTSGAVPASLGRSSAPLSYREALEIVEQWTDSLEAVRSDELTDTELGPDPYQNRPSTLTIQEEEGDLTLSATFLFASSSSAVINGRTVKVGDPIGRYRVSHIASRTVELDAGGRKVLLRMAGGTQR